MLPGLLKDRRSAEVFDIVEIRLSSFMSIFHGPVMDVEPAACIDDHKHPILFLSHFFVTAA